MADKESNGAAWVTLERYKTLGKRRNNTSKNEFINYVDYVEKGGHI